MPQVLRTILSEADRIELNNIVAARIVWLRKARGMDQPTLAAIMGIHQQTISRWENGNAGMTVASLVTLARALAIEPGDLLKGL